MRFWMAVLETIAKKCFATKLAMTKVWFPLQPLKKKKKKKIPAAHYNTCCSQWKPKPRNSCPSIQISNLPAENSSCPATHQLLASSLQKAQLPSPSLCCFFPSFPLFSVFHEPRVINTVSEFPMNSWTEIHGISSKDYQILSFPFNFCFYTRMVQAKHF